MYTTNLVPSCQKSIRKAYMLDEKGNESAVRNARNGMDI